MKIYQALFVGFLISISSIMHPTINSEIKHAVRKSLPDKLERLLKDCILTAEEQKDLLYEAGEITVLNNRKLARKESKDLYIKKKRKRYAKVSFLTGAGLFGVMFACVGISEFLKFDKDSLSMAAVTALMGSLSGLSFYYAIPLYNKIQNARSDKQRYLDAIEVEQILKRKATL